MNQQLPTPHKVYTIESITNLRKAKQEELRRSRQRMQSITENLFAPQQSKNKMENLLQHVNAGIAAYDGIRTGMIVLNRIRAFFGKKKKRS